jgi:hypothetical protein
MLEIRAFRGPAEVVSDSHGPAETRRRVNREGREEAKDAKNSFCVISVICG